jgi:hypothetical protein
MKTADIERAERRAYVGSTTTQTFHSQASAQLELEGQGRFAEKATVVGSKPAVAYPRQPSTSHWAGDPVPNEEPFGVDITAQEPTGNYHEIAESLNAASVLAFPPDADASAGVDVHSDPGVPAPTSGFLAPQEVGALSPNVIADPPSDNPTNAEVGGEAGRDDVGGGITGHGVEGPLSMTLAQRAASTFIRRGRKL